MADKKVTTMVIEVDLGCHKCIKKIKKILCGIPQIQSQNYDEKANTVTVTVACCSPDKIKNKIFCKGGDSVKGIEIKAPENPKEPKMTKEESEMQKEIPKEEKKQKKVRFVEPPKEFEVAKLKPALKKPKPPAPAKLQLEKACERPCCQGFGSMGTPCSYQGYETVAPYYEAYGRPVYDSWGGGGGTVYYGGSGCQRGSYVGESLSECNIM